MRILLIALSLILFSSCYVMKYDIKKSVLDLRPYTEEGFLISTSNSFGGNYETIGYIAYECESGYLKGGSQVVYCQLEELLNTAVKDAKASGADAIIDFHISRRYRSETRVYPSVTISGLAIKRHSTNE